MRINCFGHLGDGNLHYNLFPTQGKTVERLSWIRLKVKEMVHEMVDAAGGSVSAEHGIGRYKVEPICSASAIPRGLAAMRAIKTALDPFGIMNPGAVLP